jgi:hypothetical protein
VKSGIVLSHLVLRHRDRQADLLLHDVGHNVDRKIGNIDRVRLSEQAVQLGRVVDRLHVDFEAKILGGLLADLGNDRE